MTVKEIHNVVIEDKIQKTIKALESNNIPAYFAADKQAALALALSKVEKGSTVSCGGSVSLYDIGLIDQLRSGAYKFLDRAMPDITAEQKHTVHQQSFFADVFFSGSNAITQDGIIYNVDGHANRISAIAFGPKRVVIVVGANKIVPNLDAAINRIRDYTCACNAKRLHTKTPCETTSHCLPGGDSDITIGCKSPGRMCCQHLITTYQKDRDRISVIICLEDLGC